MKILFAIFLFIIFILSILHLILLSESSYGAYTLIIASFIAFSSYFAVTFLGLEIQSKVLSLKKQVQSLETTQKELKQLVTSLYKLSLINFACKKNAFDSNEFYDEHIKITEEIEKYFDEKEMDSFILLLRKIQNESERVIF